MAVTGAFGIFDMGNLLYVSVSIVVFANLVGTIFKDEVLSEHYLLVITTILALLLVCCLTTISNVCLLRRKDEAKDKPIWKLRESDLESEDDEEEFDEYEEIPLWDQVKLLFIRSKKIYGLIAKFGAFFITCGIVMKVISLYLEPTMKEDLGTASLIVAGSGLYLVVVVWQAYFMPKANKPNPTYKPFDEYVRIPMKVFVPDVVLHLARNFLHIAGVMFYQSAAIYGLVTVNTMSESEIGRFVEKTGLENVHQMMRIAMIIANLTGLIILIDNVFMAVDLAKEDMLLTFEKNFRRNMVALDFFLSDKETETLEELSAAFLEKSRRRDLTEEEKEALKYIETPLWKSKRSFLLKRQGTDQKPDIHQDDTTDQSGPSTPDPLDATLPPHVSLEEAVSSSPIPSPPVTRSKAKLK